MKLDAHDHVKELFDSLVQGGYTGRVTVHLADGKAVTGTIGPIGNEAMIIKALDGRDFFDAYVVYDAITCVEVQTRS